VHHSDQNQNRRDKRTPSLQSAGIDTKPDVLGDLLAHLRVHRSVGGVFVDCDAVLHVVRASLPSV